LIEIGSKTAEKNSAQTNRQADKPTDTTKIMVTWPWTNTTKARFSRLLWHPAWKWRGPILVSVLHKSVTYLLRHPLTAPGPHGAPLL